MLLLLKLSWRNIFRNKRRTILTAIVIGIGLFALIFQNALFRGMLQNIFQKATHTFLGQAQIHHKDFLLSHDVENTISHPEQIERILNTNDEIQAWAPRVISPCMLSSAKNSSAITLYGISFKKEKKISCIQKALIDGTYAKKKHSIAIGQELAKLLEVKLKDHIVATVAQAHTGELSQELFEIDAIFNFSEPALDKGAAFILIDTCQKLIGLQGQFHEISLIFKNATMAYSISKNLKQTIAKTGNEILLWKKLIPSLESILELAKYGTLILMFIVFILVIFIIMNSLFMSLFERMKEFGVLRAIGTKPKQLFALILLEAVSLAIFSIAIGLFLGITSHVVLSIIGINYAGIDIGGVTMVDPIYPIFHYEQITIYPLTICLFTLITAIYPAIVASKITPIKAMQKED